MKHAPFLLLLLCSFLAYGQKGGQPQLGVWGGGVAYQGDLGGYRGSSLAGGISFLFNSETRLTGGVTLGLGEVQGSNHAYAVALPDGTRLTPNTEFLTRFQTLFFSPRIIVVQRWGFSLDFSQGFGVMRYVVYEGPADSTNQLIDQPETRAANEQYGTTAVVLPTSVQLRYRLPGTLEIAVRAGWFTPFTDYLDNISAWGVDEGNDQMRHVSVAVYFPLGKPQSPSPN